MKKFRNSTWLFIALGFVGYFIFKTGKRAIIEQLLKKNPQITKGIVINEKNYNGNDDVNPDFTYSYQFEIDGKKYIGDSHNTDVFIGDTIEIEYYERMPSLNRSLHRNE